MRFLLSIMASVFKKTVSYFWSSNTETYHLLHYLVPLYTFNNCCGWKNDFSVWIIRLQIDHRQDDDLSCTTCFTCNHIFIGKINDPEHGLKIDLERTKGSTWKPQAIRRPISHHLVKFWMLTITDLVRPSHHKELLILSWKYLFSTG